MSEHQDPVTQARSSIQNTLNDSVTKLLLSNSQLTGAQLETLLADSLMRENDAKKGQRRLFRPSRTRISRGAYNRSLIQAQKNIIRSIYTVLLLGYVGLFDVAELQPFIELSDTIRTYVLEAQQAAPNRNRAIDELNRRLLETISALAGRQSFKDLL